MIDFTESTANMKIEQILASLIIYRLEVSISANVPEEGGNK
jgi:hypothetical protein